MSVTGLDVFDTTVHRTNAWLKRLMELEGWPERREAYRALRATLHALRDRLTIEEAAQLSAQLPMLVRGIYFEGWDPTGKPVRDRHLEDFLLRMDRELEGDPPIDAEEAAVAVFQVLQERVTDGEMQDVMALMPRELAELWAGGPVAGQPYEGQRPFA
jgi:uncharacterized protein (DUF2267 family)